MSRAEAQYTPAGDIWRPRSLDASDYLTVDSPAKRLYLSHGAEVVVIDTGHPTSSWHIADTPGVHGIAIAPSGKVFTSDGHETQVAVALSQDPEVRSMQDRQRRRQP